MSAERDDAPKRLLSGGSPLAQDLLRAGRDEEGPSADLEARILAAVAALPRPPDPTGPGGGGGGGLARSSGTWLTGRTVLGTVAAVGAAAVVAMSALRGAPPAEPPRPPVTATGPTAAAPSPVPVAPPEPETPSTRLEDLPNAPTTPMPSGRLRAPAMQASSAIAPAPVPSTEREVELLDAVKSKLGAGAADGAARALDAYDAEFPQGVLRPEATVLRIRTLLLRGDREGARKLADAFLATHPSSVHAKRVRSLLGDQP